MEIGKCGGEEAVCRESKGWEMGKGGREMHTYKDLPLLSALFYLEAWCFLYIFPRSREDLMCSCNLVLLLGRAAQT